MSNGTIACAVLFLLIVSSACVLPQKNTGAPALTGVTKSTPVPAETQRTDTPSPTTQVPRETVSPSPVPVVTNTREENLQRISDESLRAKIQDSKNKLDQLKDSDKADTIVISGNNLGRCDVKKSKELGYLIDANTGEAFFITGNYWSIDADLFTRYMEKDHDYVVIHTHPKMWTTCGNVGVFSLNTFSLGDLAAASNLTENGYHILKLIAVSDMDYEIYPKIEDDWKSKETVYDSIDAIETFMGVKFSQYDPYFDKTFYDVDNLMPMLAKRLNYTYTANHVVMA